MPLRHSGQNTGRWAWTHFQQMSSAALMGHVHQSHEGHQGPVPATYCGQPLSFYVVKTTS